MPEAGRANIFGIGLIGASLGMALAARGWKVTGQDVSPENLKQALELGAISETGIDPEADISFIAVPVGEIVQTSELALSQTKGIVTDVGSVKSNIAASLAKHPEAERFVGGHPMAGNELEGAAGASPDLFEGTIWVLTPASSTSDAAYLLMCDILRSLGAEVATLPAEEHDRLVAVVSHIPHLTAGALLRTALAKGESRDILMRLAAGGFRDMTRVASGHPSIWLDICEENKEAICESLDVLIQELSHVREIVKASDKDALSAQLSSARDARISLPVGAARPQDLTQMRVSILDRPGSVAEVATLASQANVNIYDFDIVHSAEGGRGVMMLVIESAAQAVLTVKLREAGYAPIVQPLKYEDG